MYLNRDTLKDVDRFILFNNYYWSSADIDTNKVWSQKFSLGNQFLFNKLFTFNMRVVWAFQLFINVNSAGEAEDFYFLKNGITYCITVLQRYV